MIQCGRLKSFLPADPEARKLLLQILVLILATQLISVILGWHYDLTDQEAYYWTWSKKPALGYYDHPPLLAWCMAFFEHFFGDSSAIVRLPAFLGRTLGTLGFAVWVFKKLSPRQAFLSCLLVLGAPSLVLGSMICVPDVIAIPLGLFAVHQAVRGSTLGTALFWGLATLAKWSMWLIAPGLLYLLWTKRGRELKSFIKADLVPFVVIGFLVQAPVFYWNSEHDWATFIFQFVARHEHRLLSFGEYVHHFGSLVGSQFFSFGFIFFTLFFILIPKSWSTFNRKLLIFTLPTLAFLLSSGVQGQLRYYWGSFLVFPLAYWIGAQLTQQKWVSERKMTALLYGNVVFTWAVAALAISLPTGSYFDSLTGQRPQLRHTVQGEVRGWREWLDHLKAERVDLANTTFYSTDFRLASQIRWALTFEFNGSFEEAAKRVGTLAPVENRNQYRYWAMPQQLKNSILVGDDRYDKFQPLIDSCLHPIKFNIFQSKLSETVIKEIRWGVCNQLQPVMNPTIAGIKGF